MPVQKQYQRIFEMATLCLLLLLAVIPVFAQQSPIRIAIETEKELGPMEIRRLSLGQGGLSDVPMWEDRIPEIRSLHPRFIRLLIQEYFEVYPKKATYHWKTLDQSVETILQTGAQPLMCIAIKPKLLFPAIDPDIVEPNSYGEWEELIYQMVKHYKEKQWNIQYWEVTNEPDIGEDGGCPSRFTAENYPIHHQGTKKACVHLEGGSASLPRAPTWWASI